MLDAHVFVLELLRFVLRDDEQFVETLGDVDTLAGGTIAGDARDAGQFRLDFGLQQIGSDFCLFKQARYESALRFEQGKHEVLNVRALMLEASADTLRRDQCLARFSVKLVKSNGLCFRVVKSSNSWSACLPKHLREGNSVVEADGVEDGSDGVTQRGEVCVRVAGQPVMLDQTPEGLDAVEVRAGGRQKEQAQALGRATRRAWP